MVRVYNALRCKDTPLDKGEGELTNGTNTLYKITKAYRQVRENVRNAVSQVPLKYNTLEEALARIASQFRIPLKRWVESSKLLQDALFQKKITEYLRKG